MSPFLKKTIFLVFFGFFCLKKNYYKGNRFNFILEFEPIIPGPVVICENLGPSFPCNKLACWP